MSMKLCSHSTFYSITSIKRKAFDKWLQIRIQSNVCVCIKTCVKDVYLMRFISPLHLNRLQIDVIFLCCFSSWPFLSIYADSGVDERNAENRNVVRDPTILQHKNRMLNEWQRWITEAMWAQCYEYFHAASFPFILAWILLRITNGI